MKKLIPFGSIPILFLFIFFSCTKTEELESNLGFEDIVVIEAYLYAENPPFLNLKQLIPFEDDVTLDASQLDGLSVLLANHLETYELNSLGQGNYAGTEPIVADIEYSISFQYQGKDVYGHTHIPAKPEGLSASSTLMEIAQIDPEDPSSIGDQPDPILLTWDNSDDSFYLVLVENIETEPESIRDFGDGEPPAQRFRNEPSRSQEFELTSRSFSYYGTHRVVLYKVNPDYSTLYEDVDDTSQNLSSPSTELENALGIFTGLNADTLYLEIQEP